VSGPPTREETGADGWHSRVRGWLGTVRYTGVDESPAPTSSAHTGSGWPVGDTGRPLWAGRMRPARAGPGTRSWTGTETGDRQVVGSIPTAGSSGTRHPPTPEATDRAESGMIRARSGYVLPVAAHRSAGAAPDDPLASRKEWGWPTS